MKIVENHMTSYMGIGSLWHGTDLLHLLWIIQSDRLDKSIDTDHPNHAGVSLTFNHEMAWSFADRSSYIFDGNHFHGLQQSGWTRGAPPMTGAVLELDVARLREAYRLVHYVDGDNDDEDEVRVLTRAIQPLSRFLVGFSFNPSDAEWFAEFLRSEFAEEDHGGSEEQAQALLALTKHPLFRSL